MRISDWSSDVCSSDLIGTVEAVLNTNVPPEIANYRQRIGRAGRSGQPIAVGLTFCRDRPLDRLALADPIDFLRREVRAPKVSLDSAPIALRHASAFRSEAHTSELQSLMRLSYAFFCL